MDINFENINYKMDDIINQFAGFLDSIPPNYAEAERMIEDILKILDNHSGIVISEGDEKNPDVPDNSFYELYKLLENEINNRASTRSADAAFADLSHVFTLATDRLFKTAEVRRKLIEINPTNDEIRDAVHEGLTEAQQRKALLENKKPVYEHFEKELVYTNTTPARDRRAFINQENGYIDILTEMEEKFGAISKLVDEIRANPTDVQLITANNVTISNIQNEIKQDLSELQRNGIVVNSVLAPNYDDFVDVANIADSVSKTVRLRSTREQLLRSEYEQIQNKIIDAQSGTITYTATDGSVHNLADEDIIRNAPDMSTVDLSTPDGMRIMRDLVDDVTYAFGNIDTKIAIADAEINVFTEHERLIDIENQQIAREATIDDRQTYIDNFDQQTLDFIDDEMQQRHEDIKAKFYGNRERAREYRERWRRFQSNRHENAGRGHIIVPAAPPIRIDFRYDRISNYPEKDEDLDFMQMESWELRNKRSAAVNALWAEVEKGRVDKKDAMKIIAELHGDTHYLELVEEERQIRNITYNGSRSRADLAAKQALIEQEEANLMMAHRRDEDYVKNYNSAHFDVKDTVAIALTGGSAMRARTNQSKKNLTIRDAVGAFFKWTPYDIKNDGKRHIIRTTIANIGGIASIPFRTLEVAIGAGVAGVTALVGKATGTYDMPTPYNVGYIHRKQARQDYYLRHGSTAIGAWFKSFFNLKVDDGQGNQVPVNDQLIAERTRAVDMSIQDKYIRSARMKLITDIEEAKRNREARKIAFKNRAKSAEVYEDIYINDPNAILGSDDERAQIAKKIMQRGVLDIEGARYAPDSFVPNGKRRHDRFVQLTPGERIDPIEHNLHEGYDFTETLGDTLWTNPVTREHIQRGNTKGMDTALRIAAAATLPAFKGLLSKWVIKRINNPDQVVPDTANYVTKTKTVTGQRPIVGTRTRTIQVSDEVDLNSDTMTFADLQRNGDTGYWSASLDKGYQGPNGAITFSSNATELQAVHVGFTDPATGEYIDWSISPSSYKSFIDANPNLNEFSSAYGDDLGFATGSNNVVETLTKLMPKDVGEAYSRYLDGKSGQDFIDAFTSSTQGAYGIPGQTVGSGMGQGWSSFVTEGIKKTITTPKEVTVKAILGYEPYTASVPYTTKEIISEYVQKGGYTQYSVDGAMSVGALSGLGEVLSQIFGPRFRRSERKTRNYYSKDDADNLKVTDAMVSEDKGKHVTRVGQSDMFDTPYNKNGSAKRYEGHHSKNDRAMSSIDGDGNAIGPVRPYDADDYEL